MVDSVRASKEKLEIVDQARRKKRWTKAALVWAEAAKISTSTLKRFWMVKRIRPDNFAAICNAVGVENWREIVDDSPVLDSGPNELSEITWLLVLSANISEINRPRAQAIIDHLKQLLDEPSLTLKRIENGSVILVISSNRQGFEWFQYLFRSGDITEILDFPVEDVRLSTVNIGEWLQNNFVEAIQKGWQTIAEIFGGTTRTPAFRANSAQRAKQIQLGDRTLALLLDIASSEGEETSVLLGIYPLARQIYLPEGLNFIVFSESGETLVEIEAKNDSQGIVQELFLQPGEHFSLEVSLNEFRITEDFVV